MSFAQSLWLDRGRRALARATGRSPAASVDIAPASPAPSTSSKPSIAPVSNPDAEPWSATRREIADALWGNGHVMPGGAEEVLRLSAPFGLSGATSLLLVGGGAGGPAQAMAPSGAWITACEADPSLQGAAAERLRRAGPDATKRIALSAWTPDAPKFRRRSNNHALLLDSMARAEPDALLPAVAEAVRPGGQLAVYELIAACAPDEPELQAWSRLERRRPPAQARAVSDTLDRLGFEVRILEDLSQSHAKLVASGWQRRLQLCAVERPSRAEAAVLLIEAELWMRRLRLLQTGKLRMLRWHAIAPAERSMIGR